MIRKIRVTEGVQAIRDDLETTQARLASDQSAKDLAQRIQPLLDELDALVARAAGSGADETWLAGFVARANEERCKLFGELMGSACVAGRGSGWAKRFFKQPARLASTTSLDPAMPARKRVPATPDDWRALAHERGLDAQALEEERPGTVGPVYMAGYAIECSLKAYLRKQGISIPTSGREGHDLRRLWQAARLGLTDWKGDPNVTMYYTQDWSTDLRYADTTGSQSLSTEKLVEGARQIARWIQNKMQRNRKPR